MGDQLDRYQALVSRREKAQADLARAEGRLESVRDQLKAVMDEIKAEGFESVTAVERAIEEATERAEAALAAVERELNQ